MKPVSPNMLCEPFSQEELSHVSAFIDAQSPVVMRAARMEVAQYPQQQIQSSVLGQMFPWADNASLRAQLEWHAKGLSLQLLLERQVLEAWTYLQEPTEVNRDQFVRGAFKALYASEGYGYGEIGVQLINQLIETLNLADYE
jgi:hypothetical protein